MSTRLDIIVAKRRSEDHNGAHKCRAGQCPERVKLWLDYMRTAELWAIEPGDNERQRQQNQQTS
jgi:hypothetical protein